jgi:tripartite-type tricarboxylate transporter receptor subunit TctC
MTTKPTRRAAMHAAAIAALGLLALPAAAQHFPDRVIKLVVPFAVGGGTDAGARDRPAGAALGQAVVIENRAGAAHPAPMRSPSRQPTATILLGSSTLSINAALYPAAVRSHQVFTPVGLSRPRRWSWSCRPKRRSGRCAELVLREDPPGDMNWSAGQRTPHHLASGSSSKMTDANLTHVQYKGAALINDLLGGLRRRPS